MKHGYRWFHGLVICAAIGGCGGEKGAATGTTKSEPSPGGGASDSTWLLAQTPQDAVSVSEAKAASSEGEGIVLRGRIGGSRQPLSSGAAFFTVVDLAIPNCAQMDMDEVCETPWDYCCEPRDVLTANLATVELVDPEGLRINADLSQAGLRPGDEVVVVGTVGPRPDAAVLVVRATGIHRVGG